MSSISCLSPCFQNQSLARGVGSSWLARISEFCLWSVKWSEVSQSCPTLYNRIDSSLPGSGSMGFSRQEYWSGLPFPSPRDLPNPGIEPRSPALQTDTLQSEPPGKPRFKGVTIKISTSFFFFPEMDKLVLKFVWVARDYKIAKTSWTKQKLEDSHLDCKTYHKASIIKTAVLA